MSSDLPSAILVFTVLFVGINIHGQRFSLRGRSYPNHGLVLRKEVDNYNGLDCISFPGCCDEGDLRGEYYFPGSMDLVPIMTEVGNNGYYRNRDSNRVILRRRSAGTRTGIFECRIRTNSSQTEYQIFYIGVYDSVTGSPTISGMSFTSASSTLTCTSTGGPATTVVWSQNCIILQQNGSNYVQNQVVTNTLTATYENTLVVNSKDSDGVYTCSVTNSLGYDSSAIGIGTDYSSSLPIVVSITSSSDTPMAGQGFTLTCQATTALVNPTYQWFNDSGRMIGSGSTLTLNPLLETSTGEYYCQVTAGSGTNQRFGCGVTRIVVQGFSLRGQTYPNHGLVLREDIGETDTIDLDPNNGLNFISFHGCCSFQNGLRGEFYFPGSTIQVPILNEIGSNGFYRNRANDRIILNRQSPNGTRTGIFECRIRTDPSQTEYKIFYIGVYDAGAGFPTISGMSFTNASSTLTCTSTGGPATTVVWRQNCIILQQNGSNYVQNQVVTNTLIATYENTLVVNSTDSDGVYTCSVTNSQGYVTSAIGIGTDYSNSSRLPIVVSINKSSSDTPMAGQSFTLTCQATTALMNPTYQWFDDSGRMIGSGSTLTLNPPLECSTGEYSCQVTAGSGADQRFGCGVTRIMQAPTGEPQGFMARVTESRNVTFTWLLPVLTERNGIITSYNLTCVNTTTGREAFLTRVYPVTEPNSYPLTGFKPDTGYNCRVFATNSQGSGPTANLSLTTQPDEPDGPPQNIDFTLVAGSPSEVQFNFDPPREDLQNGFISAYRISCVDRDGTRAAITMTYISSLSRPYTLSSLIPATLYDCSLSARTSPGFGVEYTVEVLTMPDKLTMISITPDKRSLLVMWNYTNPILSEGAVISGYRVYLNSQRVGELTSSTMNQFNITSLSPSTVYTVEVSAFNTRGDGMEQEGPRSDPQPTRTLGVPGSPICPRRWCLKSLSSLTLSWQPPVQSNGDITGYFLELVSFDNSTVLQSASISNLLNYTFTGFSIVAGVPYHVRVYAENSDGRGTYCTTTDFGDQLAPPSNILNDLVSSYVTGDSSSVLLTWTVLSLDQTKGFITLSITFGPLVSRASRKRQTSGESPECSQSPCLVSYDKGRVRISGLDSQKYHFIFVIPENEEGEVGTQSAFGVASTSQCSNTISQYTCPPSNNVINSNNSAAVTGMAAVIVVLVLFFVLSLIFNVVSLVRAKSRRYKLPATAIFSSEQADHEIMTTQCEAYEVMKLKEQPRRAGQTTTVPDVTYEEVGEGLTSWGGCGLEAEATPQQEQTATPQMYDEVSHGTEMNRSPAHQGAETSHYD